MSLWVAAALGMFLAAGGTAGDELPPDPPPPTPFRSWATIGAIDAFGSSGPSLPGPTVGGGLDWLMFGGSSGLGLQLELGLLDVVGQEEVHPLVTTALRLRTELYRSPRDYVVRAALFGGVGFASSCRGDVCGFMGKLAGAELCYAVPIDEAFSVFVRASAEFMNATFGARLLIPSLSAGLELK